VIRNNKYNAEYQNPCVQFSLEFSGGGVGDRRREEEMGDGRENEMLFETIVNEEI
jgi:hypothetical protein